jgi:hypothetical protein
MWTLPPVFHCPTPDLRPNEVDVTIQLNEDSVLKYVGELRSLGFWHK